MFKEGDRVVRKLEHQDEDWWRNATQGYISALYVVESIIGVHSVDGPYIRLHGLMGMTPERKFELRNIPKPLEDWL